MRNKPWTFWALSLVVALLLGGCAAKTEGAKPIVFDANAGTASGLQTFQSGHAEYVLGAGDTVEIEVYRSSLSEFVLWSEDVINISVFDHEELSFSSKIDPSGLIMFPLIGDIAAAGKDIFDLRDEIEQRLEAYIVSPRVTISLNKEQDLKIKDLSFTDKIDDSGRIIFPTLGDIMAAGKNVFELRDEIQEKLGASLINPMVTIKITSQGSHKIMVLGEVNNPNILAFGTDLTLVEALVKSGGATHDAKLDNVIIIRKGKDQNEIYTADVKKILMGNNLGHDLYLRNGDIVYVPATTIANVSRVMSHVARIVSPIVQLESGISIWPNVEAVLSGKDPSTSNFAVTIPAE